VSRLPPNKQLPGPNIQMGSRACKKGLIAILPLLMLQFGSAQAAEIKDPMQPPEYALKKFRQAKNKNRPASTGIKVKKVEIKPMKLTSIIYSSTRKIAIIDEQMLVVGGTINGAKLVKIDRHGARLVRNGKVINLRLPDDLTVIKKTPVASDT
jgi:hypothetical protein